MRGVRRSPKLASMEKGPDMARNIQLRFLVVGAGMSGILAAVKLRESGFDDVVVLEKADRLGGARQKRVTRNEETPYITVCVCGNGRHVRRLQP